MKFPIRGFVFAFVVIGLVGCGGSDWTENQVQYQFNQAFVNSNTTDAQIDQLRTASSRIADKWNAWVDNVYEEGEFIVIAARYGSQKYRLKIFDDNAKSKAMSLSKEAHLLFSGDIGYERSITMLGARANAEFEFYPTSIVSGKTIINQDAAIIAGRIQKDKLQAEGTKQQLEQAVTDAAVGVDVVKLCKRVVLETLRYPASGSFSWFKKEVEKESESKWIYRDVVTAKNALGAEIPSRFVCTVTIENKEMEASVRILE